MSNRSCLPASILVVGGNLEGRLRDVGGPRGRQHASHARRALPGTVLRNGDY